MQQKYLIYGYALALSFLLAAGLTYFVRRIALRHGFLDHPGERKMHTIPMPLLGGVAIAATFYAVVLAHLVALGVMKRFGMPYIEEEFLLFLGAGAKVKVGGILAGGLIIFLIGIVDDLKALTPFTKLVGQIAAAFVLVASGIQLDVFVLSGHWWLYGPVTIFWVVLMINALNFLDNMDGLCGGISVIAAFTFFLCVRPEDQLVRLLLMVFAGAVGGFLYHNLSPARIFMGDSGSMFCGYFLATIAVLGTFHVQSTRSPIAVAAPLLALSVPLFDILGVVYIRWRNSESIMLGDKRHFSHRLVELGMSPRQAVEFIFLGTAIILAQTVGVFLLIVLLMNAGKK